MRKTLLLAAAAAVLCTPAFGQNASTPAKAAATIVPPFVLGAALSTTSTVHWTTIATQKWFYPWHLSPAQKFSFVSTNFPQQTVNAVSQHVSNVANPHYFNEAIKLDLPNKFPDTGTHKVKADYKQRHSRTSKSAHGKAIVGCIFGSAVGAISASIRKASAMGNPIRWRSQAEHERIVASGYEKQFELTSEEAQTAVAFCGAGSLTLRFAGQ